MSIDPAQLVGALSEDEDVRSALKALALSSIASAQDLMDHAIPAIRIQVIRSILPALTKALQQNDQAELHDLRDSVAGMYELIQSQIANTPT